MFGQEQGIIGESASHILQISALLTNFEFPRGMRAASQRYAVGAWWAVNEQSLLDERLSLEPELPWRRRGVPDLDPPYRFEIVGRLHVPFTEKAGISAANVPPIRIVKEQFSRCADGDTTGKWIAGIPIRACFMHVLKALSACSKSVAAVTMTVNHRTRRLSRSRGNRWPRATADTVWVSNAVHHVRFGDYLQSLVDEQALLRREY